MADETTCLPSTARYWDIQHRLTVLNLSNESQVQQRPHMVVRAEESQANCWQKATSKMSLFSCCFEKPLEPYNMDLPQGGTRIWVGQGCAAGASKPIPICKGDFGQKGYPFLKIFLQK